MLRQSHDHVKILCPSYTKSYQNPKKGQQQQCCVMFYIRPIKSQNSLGRPKMYLTSFSDMYVL